MSRDYFFSYFGETVGRFGCASVSRETPVSSAEDLEEIISDLSKEVGCPVVILGWRKFEDPE